jgi:hypothetical protein
MRFAPMFLSSCLLASMATFASASPDLTGTSVTGSLTFGANTNNYFDKANGFVPANGYANSGGLTTVPIGAGAEFGFADSGNTDVADFTSNGLTITDTAKGGGSNSSFTLTFSDPSFYGFKLLSDTFPGLTYSYVGTTLTINVPSFNLGAGATDTAVFADGVAATTPEPSSFVLLGTGVLGIAGIARRRFMARG